MKRTKFPNNDTGPMKRTKFPDTTEDGRILGEKIGNYIPNELRDKIPSSDASKRSKTRKATWAISQMCRTRMPLALSPDGEVEIGEKKTKLRGINQAKFNALIAGLKTGMTKPAAAKLAGISHMALYNWLNRGEKGEMPYVYIAAAIKEAEAELELELMAQIKNAGIQTMSFKETTEEESTNEHGETTYKAKTVTKERLPTWNACAWILERTRPEYRLSTDITEHNAPDIDAELEAMKNISAVRPKQEEEQA